MVTGADESTACDSGEMTQLDGPWDSASSHRLQALPAILDLPLSCQACLVEERKSRH